MAEDHDGFDFGDFKSSPPLSQPPPFHANGFSSSISTSTARTNDYVWGSFFSSPLPQQTPISNPAALKPGPSPHHPDPSPVGFQITKGALPLSLFGEVEDDEDTKRDDDTHHELNHDNSNDNNNKLNGWYDPNKTAQNGKLGDNHQQIPSQKGSGLNSEDHNGGDDFDDDDWEFMGASPGKGGVQGNSQGGSTVVAGAKVEPAVVMALENQAGQDAFKSMEQKPGFSSFFPQSDDLFGASRGGGSNLSEKGVGPSSTSGLANGFLWDAFPVVERNDNISGASATVPEPGSSTFLSQSDSLLMLPSGVGDKSRDLEDVGSKAPTVATNNLMWDAFTGVEKVIDGSGTSVNQVPASSFLSPPDDLFASLEVADSKSSEVDVRHKPTTIASTGLMWDPFTAAGKIGNDIGTNASATTSNSVEQKPVSSSFLTPSDDLFASPSGAVNNSTETDNQFMPNAVRTNSFTFDAFPGVKDIGTEDETSAPGAISLDEDDDFDDFGDFVDASKESRTMEKEKDVTHAIVTEAQLPNGKSQDKPTQLGNGRGALPLSLFGDDIEETSESLNHSDDLIHKPSPKSGNGLSSQSSVVSIHDLISNLYSQGQNTPSGQPTENNNHDSKEQGSLSLGDDDWDDDSWEFKGALRGAGVEGQPSGDSTVITARTQSETSQNLQIYIGFYSKLRNSLCFLLSCQVDELKKAQSLDTRTSAELTEASSSGVQELLQLLEDSMISQDVLSQKNLERSICLNEVLQILQGPDIQAIESEYSLSKKLQLAVNDWRVAADLLRQTISILKCLSLGSADDQFHYVSTWSKIINICAQELRYGASIWKRASQQKVQLRILTDCRGKRYIQALGEIHRIVELLRLSARVYKPWILVSVPESSQFTGLLNECCTLWLSSKLNEALQNLSDNSEFGCDESAKALVASIKDLSNFDELAINKCVLGQHKSICQLSLLPQEIFSDLKTVVWNGQRYFLSLANLWANLISCDPPQLPRLLVD